MFNQETFNQFILDNNIIGFFDTPITLKSGQQSYFYVNWRTISSDVALLDQCVDYLIDYCHDSQLQPECFFGVPEGATKLGIITQYKWAQKQNCKPGSHILPMGRSKPKEHGAAEDKHFIGKPTGSVILLEDVTTTGDSMLNTLDHLQNHQINVIAVIALTNREYTTSSKTVAEKVSERGIPYHCLSYAKPLLKSLSTQKKAPKELETELDSLK